MLRKQVQQRRMSTENENIEQAIEASVIEIIICMVKKEPIIYDKSIESKLNVIAVKKQIFDEISQAIHVMTYFYQVGV